MLQDLFHIQYNGENHIFSSHRYFIEPVSELSHVKVLLASRQVKFHKMMLQSKRSSIALLATINEKNSRTRHGNNLLNIAKDSDTGLENLTSQPIKENMKFVHFPEQDEWKIPIVNEVLNVQNDCLTLSEFDKNDTKDMIKMLTTS